MRCCSFGAGPAGFSESCPDAALLPERFAAGRLLPRFTSSAPENAATHGLPPASRVSPAPIIQPYAVFSYVLLYNIACKKSTPRRFASLINLKDKRIFLSAGSLPGNARLPRRTARRIVMDCIMMQEDVVSLP